MRFERESRLRRIMIAAASIAVLGVGCRAETGVEGTDDGSGTKAVAADDAAPRPESWRERLSSSEAAERAIAVDLIPVAPGDDGAARLEEAFRSDPDSYVRERAVFAISTMRGRDAVPFLTTVATSEADENVRSAALAEIFRFRNEHPVPARGWMKVHYPESVTPGEPFEVRVTIGSTDDVRRAKVGFRVPRGMERLSPGEPLWKGTLAAGETREVAVTLRAPAAETHAAVLAKLSLEYPELLDTELVKRAVRLDVESGTGTLRELGPEEQAPRSEPEVPPPHGTQER